MRPLASLASAALAVAIAPLGACTLDDSEAGLFACEIPQSCPAVTLHTEQGPPEAVRCHNELIASGGAGALVFVSAAGPYLNVTETLMIFPGDGTVLRQSRHKECEGCDPETLEWESASDLEACDVVVTGDLAACGVDGECDASVAYENCRRIEPMTCEDVEARLASPG